METGKTFYFEGNEESSLVGGYVVERVFDGLLFLEKLDVLTKENPDYVGRLIHDCDGCGNSARAKPLTGKGLIGLLFKIPSCAGFPERHFLDTKHSSIRRKN